MSRPAPTPAEGPAAGPLAGRRVVLGVCAGIAAYKAAELARALVAAGAHVVPVMTRDAARFIGEATLSALASEPVRTSLFEGPDPIPHTTLARSADAVVVAPATAHLLAQYATGLAGDLLTATLLATTAPVVLAPAMHTEMWEHPAVQDNVALLRRRGVVLVGPDAGPLAGGDSGIGRLAATADIVAAVAAAAGSREGDLSGLRVLVSAGGTREPIDPVRYIGNRSSGRQGLALAEEARRRGAAVTLVTTVVPGTAAGIEVVPVETAAQMQEAMLARARSADIVVMSAAVADWRPVGAAPRKLASADGPPEVVLEATPDISAKVAAARRHQPPQVLVAFAAETADGPADLLARARSKLLRKGVDLVVANDVSLPGVGFGHQTNAVAIVGADGPAEEVPLAPKEVVATAVLDAAAARLARRAGGGEGAAGRAGPPAGKVAPL